MTSSADGSKLAAAAGGTFWDGPVYVSTNHGSTWFHTSLPRTTWACVACAADGKILLSAETGTNGGLIFISRDSGVDWRKSPAPQTNWASIACSADGSRLVAAVGSPFGVSGPIYPSDDAGENWHRTSAPIGYWNFVASSASGATLVASTCYLGSRRVYFSRDFGRTWTPMKAPLGCWALACSADASTLIGVSAKADGGAIGDMSWLGTRIRISTNSGNTWTESTLETGGFPFSVASSADGARLAFTVDGGLVYVSGKGPQ